MSRKVIDEAAHMGAHGVAFGKPTRRSRQAARLQGRRRQTIDGRSRPCSRKQRKVTVDHRATRNSPAPNTLVGGDGGRTARRAFRQGDHRGGLGAGGAGLHSPSDKRIWDSTGALDLGFTPKRMLVLGGGIIGLEMATVYEALGSEITVVEMMDQLMPGADRDIVAPFAKRVGSRYKQILLKTKVTKVEAKPDALYVSWESEAGPGEGEFDAMLVAVGRSPNGKLIGAEAAGIDVDARGYIAVDKQLRTNVSHIFAIGDIAGAPMLAHKATHEGHVAAEVASGHRAAFDAKCIPSVAYTDPEVAWVGITETEAKARGVKYGKAVFPWAASGRSLALGRDEGLTKTLWDEASGQLIGCGIVGPSAGDLIAEAGLAIEMGCDAEDIGLTIHPHPTLSETIGMSAEGFAGTLTDLYMPKKKK